MVPLSDALTISDEQVGGVSVVRCAGEIDLATVGLLRSHLQDAQVDGPASLVVVLDEVTFLDSLGLGALIGAHKRARVLQGSLVIVCTSPPVLRILAATALDRVFRVVDDLDDAIAAATS